jgi:hypothetical protein
MTDTTGVKDCRTATKAFRSQLKGQAGVSEEGPGSDGRACQSFDG